MILRQAPKGLPHRTLFCAAALVVGAAAGVSGLRMLLAPTEIAACSDRYNRATELPLASTAGLLSAPDLQARLGGRDRGLIENGRLVKDGPNGAALAVRLGGPADLGLTRASLSGDAAASPGLAFKWAPASVAKIEAVCARYAVWLPRDFDFGRGGTLPAIEGPETPRPGTVRGKGSFSAMLRWRSDGRPELVTQTIAGEESVARSQNRDVVLERGRWLTIDQELILNRAGERNGVARVWVDGTLAIERLGLGYRETDAERLTGLTIQAFHGTPDSRMTSARPTEVRLSGFELRWQ